jgi:hypothetical protein
MDQISTTSFFWQKSKVVAATGFSVNFVLTNDATIKIKFQRFLNNWEHFNEKK